MAMMHEGQSTMIAQKEKQDRSPVSAPCSKWTSDIFEFINKGEPRLLDPNRLVIIPAYPGPS